VIHCECYGQKVSAFVWSLSYSIWSLLQIACCSCVWGGDKGIGSGSSIVRGGMEETFQSVS